MIFEMMGEKFDKNAPIAMQSDVFPRFIINCRDGRTIFKENDTLEFELIIFDNLTELFIQYIYVFETIGQSGLGPEKARYELLSVSDGKGNIYIKIPCLLEMRLYQIYVSIYHQGWIIV